MKAQEIMFELMKVSSFNGFDGEKTVKLLKEHPELWKGIVWGKFKYSVLLPLRDIASDYYNADTLYALVPEKTSQQFMNLMKTLNPDECDDVTDKEWEIANYGSWRGGKIDEPGYRIIRVWWD